MKKMMILFLTAMAVAATGCKKKDDSGAALAKLEDFRKQICDCKDRSCALKVSLEMSKWSEDNAQSTKEGPKLTTEEQAKFTQIGKDIGDCLQRAEGSEAGSAAGSDNGAPGSTTLGSAGSAAPAGSAAEGSAAAGSAAPASTPASSAAAGSAAKAPAAVPAKAPAKAPEKTPAAAGSAAPAGSAKAK